MNNEKEPSTVGIIITGSRDYNDLERVRSEIEKVVQRETERGGEDGENVVYNLLTDDSSPSLESFVSTLSMESPKRYSHTRVKALWDKYGKKAGYWRDKKLCSSATYCLVFREGSKDEMSSASYRFLLPMARKERLIIRDFPTLEEKEDKK